MCQYFDSDTVSDSDCEVADLLRVVADSQLKAFMHVFPVFFSKLKLKTFQCVLMYILLCSTSVTQVLIENIDKTKRYTFRVTGRNESGLGETATVELTEPLYKEPPKVEKREEVKITEEVVEVKKEIITEKVTEEVTETGQ